MPSRSIPGPRTHRERLAFVSMQCQDWNGAVHEAREALRLDPFLRFARMFLVQCLLHDKDTKAADNEFATLVKLHADQRESLEEWTPSSAAAKIRHGPIWTRWRYTVPQRSGCSVDTIQAKRVPGMPPRILGITCLRFEVPPYAMQ